MKQGWKPKRTIILASWDAEEWGLIGSTEWAEQFAKEIQDKAVVYFNTDSNFQGVMSLQGSHTLERFLNDVARAVPDPKTGRSVWERDQGGRDEGREATEKKKELDSRRDLRIAALGSGSDYTVFLDHLAIASTNAAFRGDGTGRLPLDLRFVRLVPQVRRPGIRLWAGDGAVPRHCDRAHG